MKGLLELIKLIFGPRALSKTIGTRTNVIKLPNNKTKRYLKQDLNIEAASDAAAMNAKKEMEELIPEIPKMNDAERLIFEGNLRRLKNRLGLRTEADPTADVFQFGTKEKVTPGGIASLTEKAGQKSPPGTLMGNIESRIKQLEARGEDLSTMKGQTLDEIMGDVASSQQGMRQLEKQGLVRATARDIITSDIKSGKLKLPKELEQQILEGGGEPIDVLRNVYGEDALEVLDSLIPEFSKLRTSTEAEKLARSKFKFEPDVNRPKGSMSLEEAAKAEQENILTPKKPEEPEEFAMGGRVRYSDGTKPSAAENTPSQEIINRMIAQIKQLSKRGVDAATIKDIVGASDQMIKDVLGKASGGRMSKGLDYLTGIERRGYAVGGTGPSPDAAETYSEYKARMLEALRKSHGGQKTANTDLQPDGSYSGVSREIPIEDYFNYMLADAYALGFNPNTGLKFGVDDQGVLTDQYKFKQEMADFKKNAQTTPTEDFSDYLNQSTDATEKPLTEYEQYVLRTQGVPVSEEVFNATKQLAPDGDIAAAGFTSDQEFFKARDELADQMISPEDALTPEVPQVSPIQEHIDFNEFLKGQGLSQQDYNVLGGYDVKEKLAPGNPILGGAINLASPVYNALQMFDSATDAKGNVIKQYVPDMYEDATESGAYYAVPAQKISDIPGSAARNVQGGLGLLSDRQQQLYQDIRNQYETQRQQYETQRQQDLENYRQRQAAVDTDQIRQSYLQNLQNTGATNVEEFQSKLQSNLMSNPNLANGGRVGFQKGTPAIFDQLEMDVPYPYGHKVETSSKGLDYLMGINRQGYATGSTNPFYSTYGGIPINMNILPSSANNPFYSGLLGNPLLTSTNDEEEEDIINAINEFKGVQSSYGGGDGGSSYGGGDTGDGGSNAGGGDAGTGPGGCDAGSSGGADAGTGPGGCSTGSTDAGTGPGGCSTGGGDGGGSSGGGDAGTGPGGCSTGSDDGGGGGGGGGKIICTAMNQAYGFGSFRQAIWLEHSKDLDPAYQVGYHAIFKPAIKYMYSSSTRNKPLAKMIRWCCEGIARRRTADIWLQKRGKGRHLIGAVERAILEPICYIVGKIKMKLKK